MADLAETRQQHAQRLVGVDGLDIREDWLGLRLLRLDARGGSRPGGEERGRGEGDQKR